MLARSKLNSIETQKIKTIITEKEKYEKVEEDIRMMKSSDELNKEEGKNIYIYIYILVKIVKMHKIKKKINTA